tara:strand:+ start:260 stop:568 length:309 start_codon:yes stop_codon:yes gene_type:complete
MPKIDNRKQQERNAFNEAVRPHTLEHWHELLKTVVDDRRYRAWAACVIWGSYTGKKAKLSPEYSALMDKCPGLNNSNSSMCEKKLWKYINQMGIPTIEKKRG